MNYTADDVAVQPYLRFSDNHRQPSPSTFISFLRFRVGRIRSGAGVTLGFADRLSAFGQQVSYFLAIAFHSVILPLRFSISSNKFLRTDHDHELDLRFALRSQENCQILRQHLCPLNYTAADIRKYKLPRYKLQAESRHIGVEKCRSAARVRVCR